MAADLASLPTTGITVQICGDAHVRNLGAFASPTGAVVFDINDFDETMPGPWEWDVKRLAASLVLSGREAAHSDVAGKEAVESFVAEYRKSVNYCSELTVLEIARYTVHRHIEAGPLPELLAKAERATPQHTLEKLTQSREGAWCFKEEKPLLTLVKSSSGGPRWTNIQDRRSGHRKLQRRFPPARLLHPGRKCGRRASRVFQ